jgi:hypothetical protein
LSYTGDELWSHGPESNRRPPAYGAGALPSKLPRHKLAGLMGFEPTVYWLTTSRGQPLLYKPEYTIK